MVGVDCPFVEWWLRLESNGSSTPVDAVVARQKTLVESHRYALEIHQQFALHRARLSLDGVHQQVWVVGEHTGVADASDQLSGGDGVADVDDRAVVSKNVSTADDGIFRSLLLWSSAATPAVGLTRNLLAIISSVPLLRSGQKKADRGSAR